MKKLLLAFAATATFGSLTTSIHLAYLEHPTDIQTQLSTTTNAIAVAGTTTIFGLLGDDDENEKEEDENDDDDKSGQ